MTPQSDDDDFYAALIGLVDAVHGGATSEEALAIASAVHDHDLRQYLDTPPRAPRRSGPLPHYFSNLPPDSSGA